MCNPWGATRNLRVDSVSCIPQAWSNPDRQEIIIAGWATRWEYLKCTLVRMSLGSAIGLEE